MLLGVMIIPGTIHKGGVLRHSVQSAGDPYWVFPGEVDALKSLDADPRRGGVLAPTYSSLLVPYRTGREAYVGPFSWTPDWEYRATSANALFEGRLTGAAGRRFIVSTHARWLFADCRPLALPALARTVATAAGAPAAALRLRHAVRAQGPPGHGPGRPAVGLSRHGPVSAAGS